MLEPVGTQWDYDHLTYDELHSLCRRLGSARRDSGAALKTRLAATDAFERGCGREMADAMDFVGNLPAT